MIPTIIFGIFVLFIYGLIRLALEPERSEITRARNHGYDKGRKDGLDVGSGYRENEYKRGYKDGLASSKKRGKDDLNV